MTARTTARAQTAVSDLEVEYSEEAGTLYHFRYPLAGGAPDEFVPVATTRPETILGDTAVAVHPGDARCVAVCVSVRARPSLQSFSAAPHPARKRRLTPALRPPRHSHERSFAALVGRELEVPMSGGRRVPLIADSYVDPEFGTGALKVRIRRPQSSCIAPGDLHRK